MDCALPLFVEFVGLPGSGKSSIVGRLDRVLAERGYRCAIRPPVISGHHQGLAHRIQFSRYHLLEWRLLRSLARYGFSIKPRKWFRVPYLRKVFFSCYYFDHHRQSEYEVILLDQFGFQALWAAGVYGSKPASTAVTQIIEAVSRDSERRILVVYVEIPPGVAVERMITGRLSGHRPGKYRFDLLDPDEAERALRASQPALQELSQKIGRTGNFQVMALDGMRPEDDNASAVADFIQTLSSR